MSGLRAKDIGRYVVIDPVTGVRHALRILQTNEDRPAMAMTVCDFGEHQLGEPAVLRDSAAVGRCDCLKCLAAEGL